MRKYIYYIIMCSLVFATSCGRTIHIDEQTADVADIFPDYVDVTIPCNIAPMNITLLNAEGIDTQLIIKAGNDELQVEGEDGDFDIPLDDWHELIGNHKGEDLTYTICYSKNGKWMAYSPFTMHVSEYPCDSHLAYRLIPPGYGIWNAMGIFQRDLESFTETAIMENRTTEYNCMNCHSFQKGNPDKMLFHIRGRHGGSVYAHGNQIEKLEPKMPEGLTGIAYPHWHPTHDFIAMASDRVAQSFYANHTNRIEVFDTRSDVVVYDCKTGIAHTAPYLSSGSVWETLPAFSADGKTLYWSAADTTATPYAIHYDKAHFSMCRTSFDPETCTFGAQPDTLFYAGDSTSYVYPRESYDGRWMVYNKFDYGYFPINHQEGDLWIMDMQTGETRPLGRANSDSTESYHSWSTNSHWLVFSSRRMDRLYIGAYFTSINDKGESTKAFLLPQRHPRDFYTKQLNSYNIPEFITGEVKLDQHKVAETVW